MGTYIGRLLLPACAAVGLSLSPVTTRGQIIIIIIIGNYYYYYYYYIISDRVFPLQKVYFSTDK
jgi:hypothetical protein